MKIEKKNYYLNAKIHRKYNNNEVVYTIEKKKPKDLIEGEPDIK